MSYLENWLPEINREWIWVIQVFCVVLATVFATFFCKRFLAKMLKKLGQTRTRWDDILLTAMTRPLVWIVWLVGLDIAVDIIYIETGSAIFSYFDSVRDVGVLVCITWFVLAIIRGAEKELSENSDQVDRHTVDAIGKLLRLAVIITVTYLAFQVRQGTSTLRANSVQELTENLLASTHALVDPDNAELYVRGIRSFLSLTPEEKLRFSVLVGLFVGRFDTVLEYRERGMVSDAYVATHADTIQRIFGNPGVREWWSSGVNTGFTARVKEWIETNAAARVEA